MVKRHMPSPFGHALAGAALAWAADLVPGRRAWRTAPPDASWGRRAGGALTLACAVLAAVPDADLLFRMHRTWSHSLGAVILVTILATAVTGWVTRAPAWRVGMMCGGAYATHLLLDWLAVDDYPPAGIQMWWPFSRQWVISGLGLFKQTERYPLFSMRTWHIDVIAVAWEAAILLPLVVLLWLVRVKALARFATELPGRNHSPQQGTGPVLRVAEAGVENIENRQAHIQTDQIGER
jgi:membrane-bound metal-dependent hydrolase YbcI (DUF457 family)